MPAASDTTPKAETTEVIISDESVVANGRLSALRSYVNASKDAIVQLFAIETERAKLYARVATNRAKARSVILLADKQPDWTGGSQTYKQEVNAAESDAFSSYSDGQKRSFDSNVRSHMRRGVLDDVIEQWVRESDLGLKDAPADSPKLAEAMRAQYARTLTQPNPIKCPDKWLDTPPAGDTPGAKKEDTPASKVNDAAVAISKLSGVERIAHIHRMATEAILPLVAPNAEVPGGRKNVANACLEVGNLFKAAAVLLGNANLSGDALTEAQAAVEKYSYQG